VWGFRSSIRRARGFTKVASKWQCPNDGEVKVTSMERLVTLLLGALHDQGRLGSFLCYGLLSNIVKKCGVGNVTGALGRGNGS